MERIDTEVVLIIQKIMLGWAIDIQYSSRVRSSSTHTVAAGPIPFPTSANWLPNKITPISCIFAILPRCESMGDGWSIFNIDFLITLA